MSEIHHPGTELDNSTYHCPYCDVDIATHNQLTHEVACARIHRNAPQREQRDQRAPAAQPIVRQSSSSAISDQPHTQPRTQPMPRREERRIAENKLVTCPNCEKSVREQDINSHMDNECLKNELIPCEFCDDSIPMSDYSRHVESCPRRSQNFQNNERPESPERERPGSMEEEPNDFPHEEPSNQRDASPERESSEGGIRGFLRNIANSAASGLRNYNENLHRQMQERQQQEREQQQRQQQRQQEMLRQMFGLSEVPRDPFSNQNALIPYNGGQRVIRTIEQGPGGSLIVRQRVIPSSGMPMGPMQMNGMGGMRMNPMEMMLLGMMQGGMGGMPAIGNGEMGQVERGLDKETIDSLALVKFSKEMNKNVDEESKKCPICLDEFEEGQDVRFLWCMHRFHKNCVDQWLDSHTNCPLCKKDFSEANASYSP